MSDGQMKIETTVTFPDGEVIGVAMHLSEELYTPSEVPDMVYDMMRRGARVITQKLQEKK